MAHDPHMAGVTGGDAIKGHRRVHIGMFCRKQRQSSSLAESSHPHLHSI